MALRDVHHVVSCSHSLISLEAGKSQHTEGRADAHTLPRGTCKEGPEHVEPI